MFKIHKQQIEKLRKKAAEKLGKKNPGYKSIFTNYKIVPGIGLIDKNATKIEFMGLVKTNLQKKRLRTKWQKEQKKKKNYIPVRFRNYAKRAEYVGKFGEYYVALRYSNFIHYDRNKSQKSRRDRFLRRLPGQLKKRRQLLKLTKIFETLDNDWADNEFAVNSRQPKSYSFKRFVLFSNAVKFHGLSIPMLEQLIFFKTILRNSLVPEWFTTIVGKRRKPLLVYKRAFAKAYFRMSVSKKRTHYFFSGRDLRDFTRFHSNFWKKYSYVINPQTKEFEKIVTNPTYERITAIRSDKILRLGLRILIERKVRPPKFRKEMRDYFTLNAMLGKIKWKWGFKSKKYRKRRKRFRQLHILKNNRYQLPNKDYLLTQKKFSNNLYLLKHSTNVLTSFKERQYKKKFIIQHNKTIYKRALRFFYGNLRYKTFNKFYQKTNKYRYDNKVSKFLEFFERLLFVVVYRMGFAPTMQLSKYIIKQGMIQVNGKTFTHINTNIKTNDLITLSREGQMLLFNSTFNKNSNVLFKKYIKRKFASRYKKKGFIELYNKIPQHLLVNFRIFSGIFLSTPKFNVDKTLFELPIKHSTDLRRKNFSMLNYYMLKAFSFYRKKGF